MSRIVKLVQGSEEWLRHRRRYRNASETAAVLGMSPWMTPFQLWEVKTGRRAVETTYAMQRGVELEPFARAAYEADTGHIMEPVVMVRGDYSASLDGMLLDNSLILEVKCPLNGQKSDTWKAAEEGRVEEHYMLQVQHQLLVSGAEACDFFVFDGNGSGICVRVGPDQDVQAKLCTAWDKFWATHIVRDDPPPLTAADTVLREDPVWGGAAMEYLQAKEAADEKIRAMEEAKRKLVALTRHTSERGYGVSVCRFWRGSKGRKEEVRVTVLKEAERC